MPILRFFNSIDPLVRLLLLATLLASIFPVTGEARDYARWVSNSAIFLLFLLNGIRLPRGEVLRGLGHMRFLLPLGLWSFVAMGLAGWGLFMIGQGHLPVEVALGLLFLGVLPSTVQSATSYTALAGGNVAASVIAAAILNILGVFITAPLFSMMGGSEVADFDLNSLMRVMMILVLPFVIGQLAQNRVGRFIRDHKGQASWMDRIAISLAVYIAFSGAVEQGLWQIVSLSEWGVLLALVALFLLFGFGGAWLLSSVLRLDWDTRIAFFFAGGQKSIALGVPLATVLFPPAVAGLLLLPILTYHLIQLILSAPLAMRLKRAGEAITRPG